MATLSQIEVGQRYLLAGQLDDVVRELQVLQGLLRSDSPTVSLAAVSTGLLGALITTREVSDAIGMAEAGVWCPGMDGPVL